MADQPRGLPKVNSCTLFGPDGPNVSYDPGLGQESIRVDALHVSWGHSEVEEVGGRVAEDDPRLVVGVEDQLDAEAATVLRLQFVLGVLSELSSSAEPRDILRRSVDWGDVVEWHGSLG